MRRGYSFALAGVGCLVGVLGGVMIAEPGSDTGGEWLLAIGVLATAVGGGTAALRSLLRRDERADRRKRD